MLSKKYHLPKSFFSKPKKRISQFESESFSVKEYKSEFPHSRFAVVVSSKILSKSTARNKYKRFLFDFLRKKEAFHAVKNDFVFILKTPVSKKTKKEIDLELEVFWKKMIK